MITHCINCEESFEIVKSDPADFCSAECAQEYAAKANPEVLQRESNTNPDALPNLAEAWNLPNSSAVNKGRVNNAATGILPPNTMEAISSLLQTSTDQEIAEAVKKYQK